MKRDSKPNQKFFGPKKKDRKNERFCVYDIETSTALDTVYMVGWYDGVEYRYWESEMLPPEDRRSAMAQFCDWFFNGDPRPICHAHNGGNFDHIFLLKWLLKWIPTATIEILTTQSSILALKIKCFEREYEFRDSFRLMAGGLDALGKALCGVGKVEGVDYSVLHLDPKRYEYLKRDCVLLYDCLVRFAEVVEKRLDGAVGLTAASTAISTLQSGYLSEKIDALPPEVDEFVRMGYYGGRCEVFRKRFEATDKISLQYYDVNSMYPWAMGQKMPTKLWGFSQCFTGSIDGALAEPGYIEATVDVPKRVMYPRLPYRLDGKLVFPTGTFSGVWPTMELRAAVAQGAKITGIGGVAMFKETQPFADFVNKMYSLRNKDAKDFTPAISAIAKLMANSAYGKLGSKKEREMLHIRPKLQDIIDRGMRPLQGPLDIPVFVEEIEVDADYMLPHLSGWITGLGRTRLANLIALCAPRAVFYCDTDSVVTTATLDTGNGLGELKLEHGDVKKAEFIAPKVYRLTTADGRVITKAKGFAEFGKGFDADHFDGLVDGESTDCSGFSKVRTFLRGDFGLLMKQKRLLLLSEKRIFNKDLTSMSYPLHLTDGKDTQWASSKTKTKNQRKRTMKSSQRG